jgi:tRNA1(Val) A37 N6-methylase TrmN6
MSEVSEELVHTLTVNQITADDIESVLFLSDLNNEKEISGILNSENLPAFLNMATIFPQDHVLCLEAGSNFLSYGLSYLSQPEKLVVTYDVSLGLAAPNPEIFREKWNIVSDLLDGYDHTEPENVITSLENPPFLANSFDVIIGDLVGSQNHEKLTSSVQNQSSDINYREFEQVLFNSSDLLKEGGRLVLAIRADWILKSWPLLEKLGLQLEYPEWGIEFSDFPEPDSSVALRFIKKDNIDSSRQKKSVLSLMAKFSIDTLYAHKADEVFPYSEIVRTDSEPFLDLTRKTDSEQYFFDINTTNELIRLARGETAFLVTPSLAIKSVGNGQTGVLFEQDSRALRQLGLLPNSKIKPQKYDLKVGLHRLIKNKYNFKFDTVICDPPFTKIKPNILARDIHELLKVDNGTAYIIYPAKDIAKLKREMDKLGFQLEEDWEKPTINYAQPPKMVRIHGVQAIQVYKFVYN